MLGEMKAARKGRAVLKIELATLRARLPDVAIFAFEGVNDKKIYYYWLSRCRPGLMYEPFVCGGKKFVLQLKDVVDKDAYDLGKNLFFFIDRDFDDSKGVPVDDRIYMTEKYSVENYVVHPDVISDLLTIEFHCHSRPDIRTSIVDLYNRSMEAFLKSTREINFRIFLARKLRINVKGGLPDKLNGLLDIELQSVSRRSMTVEAFVPLEREPTSSESDELRPEFDALVASDRYRGKFALDFAQKWLHALAVEWGTKQVGVFGDIDERATVQDYLTLDAFASKCVPPGELVAFVARAAS